MRLIRHGNILLAGFMCLCAPLGAQPAPSRPAPPPLEAYGDLPGIEDMALEPGGAGLAIAARIKGERQLLVLDSAGAVRTKASLGDMKIRSVNWADPDFIYVEFSRTETLGLEFLKNKTESFGAAIVPLRTPKPELVFSRNPDMTTAIWSNPGVRKVGGKSLVYFEGLQFVRAADQGYTRGSGGTALFAVNVARNSPHKVAAASPAKHHRSWLVDISGDVAATLDIDASNGRWAILNAKNNVIANGTDLTGDIWLVALGTDGKSVIYGQEDDRSGHIPWLEVPLVGGPAKEILVDSGVKEHFIDPSTGRLLGYVSESLPARPMMFDPTIQAAFSKIYRAFGKYELSIRGWTADFGKFLVHTSGNTDSGTWYVVDMAKLKADPVGFDRISIGPEHVGPISTIAYTAADGMEMDGILTLPPGREARNLPAIILPHGGPTAHDSPEFDYIAQAFASRGYAVFQPNFRGSTNRDDAFRRAGYGEWGRKMQTDLSDGLAELARRGIVEPKRTCIMGGSYGGYAALAGVTLQKGIYRCAVAIAPVSDLEDRYNTRMYESGGSRMNSASLRESLGHPSTFNEVSPRRHAAQADAPILLIHGKDDTVVPFRQSQAMADALKAAGKPFEMVVMQDEDHWLSRAPTRKLMLENAMRFVQKYNPAD